MKRRSLILLLGGASGGGALAIGSGAFSSGAAERGVNVGVVPDDQAYVGYEIQGDGDSDPPEIVVTAGEYEELVRVKNRFPEGTEIEIVEASAPELNIRHDKHSFGSGKTAGIDGTCNGEGTTNVELTVTVEAVEDDEVSARLFGDTETRRFTIRCEGPDKNDSFAHLVVEIDEETGEYTFYTDGPKSDDRWTLEVDLDVKSVTQTPPKKVTVSEPSSGTVRVRNPSGKTVDEWTP